MSQNYLASINRAIAEGVYEYGLDVLTHDEGSFQVSFSHKALSFYLPSGTSGTAYIMFDFHEMGITLDSYVKYDLRFNMFGESNTAAVIPILSFANVPDYSNSYSDIALATKAAIDSVNYSSRNLYALNDTSIDGVFEGYARFMMSTGGSQTASRGVSTTSGHYISARTGEKNSYAIVDGTSYPVNRAMLLYFTASAGNSDLVMNYNNFRLTYNPIANGDGSYSSSTTNDNDAVVSNGNGFKTGGSLCELPVKSYDVHYSGHYGPGAFYYGYDKLSTKPEAYVASNGDVVGSEIVEY